ncbi:hypothetical protein WA556_005013, partial [Blastocystis sp. ATCC 50177/Nand II]
MEDVRRTPFYSTYPEKELPPQEDTLNAYSIVSLMFGLVAVMFGSKLMGWMSLFTGVASLTQLRLAHVDVFSTLVTVGFSVMSMISSYIKVYSDMLKKKA